MSYTTSIVIHLGASNTGLTLKAQLFNAAGAQQGADILTGFTELADGDYHWAHSAVPDGLRGYVKFLKDNGTYMVSLSVNPEEIENPDIKTSKSGGPAISG